MKRTLLYWLTNLVVYIFFWFGIFEGNPNAANVLKFYIGFSFLVSLVLLIPPFWKQFHAEYHAKGLPPNWDWLNNLMTIVEVAVLAWAGWFWCATAWTIAGLIGNQLRKPPKKEET